MSVALLALARCSSPKDRVVIQGEIQGVKQAEFYVYSEDGTDEKVDTVRIIDGTFVYERLVKEPTVLTLLYPNFSRTLLVAEPGTEIRFEGNAAHLGAARIVGTEENELLTEFRQTTADFPAEKARLAAADFIRSHAGTTAAVAVYMRHFAPRADTDAPTAASLLAELKQAQPKSTAVAALEGRVAPLLAAAPGMSVPDFAAPTIQGDTVRRADFKGRPYVVMFWASWSAECNGIPEAVKRLHTAYGDRIGLLVVSADYSRRDAERLVRRDSLPAAIVCEQRGISAPVARKIGMRYVPGNLLVGADGRIVARDLPLNELERRADELF